MDPVDTKFTHVDKAIELLNEINNSSTCIADLKCAVVFLETEIKLMELK